MLQSEVLVVGAGPVGLMAALSLAERGVEVNVVDQMERFDRQNFALALHPETLPIVEPMLPALVARGKKVHKVVFHDRERPRAELRFGEVKASHPFLLLLSTHQLEELLEERLRAKGVRVRYNHRLAGLEEHGGRVGATLEKLAVESGGYPIGGHVFAVDKVVRAEARYLVAADGFHSAARRLAGIGFKTTAAPTSYGVVEIDAGRDTGDELRVVIDGARASALWPLPQGRWRWCLELEGRERLEGDDLGSVRTASGLSAGRLAAIIRERAPWFELKPGASDGAVRVRFDPGIADRFGLGRVWLAGDAAHVTEPIGVHSMNGGLREAADLAALLAGILKGDSPTALLDRYHHEQSERWRKPLGLGGKPTARPEADPWVAEHAGRMLPCIPGLGAALEQMAGQIGIDL